MVSKVVRSIALAVGIAGCYGSAVLAASVDWIQSYNNERHSGENPHETVLSATNVSGLQLGWARSASGEIRELVLNDHYVIARLPSDDRKDLDLWYLNAATGETVWRIDTGPDIAGANGTIATGQHLIFSECGLVDKVGYNYSGICAYKKGNGHRAWRFSNPCNCWPEANVVTPLVFSKDVLFFGYFNGGNGGSEYVIAARALTGEILGAYRTGGMGSLGSAPITRGAGQVLFDCGGSICALSHLDGTFRWKTDVGGPIGAISVDASGTVYANLCNGPVGLIALNGLTGAPLWSYGAPECNRAPAAIAGNRVYFWGADNKSHALDAATGQELWSAAWGTASSASLANGVMYVSGAVHAPSTRAYDAKSGKQLWSAPASPAKHRPPPVAVDGVLYVANGACGSICAFNPPAGTASQARTQALPKSTKR